ncbi:MAG: ORF6N domain-containing protein [Lentimicrobiaceae bacterium]|nr:ORF6N domain-containing protein [Lentimicrobiaceae bacterium]
METNIVVQDRIEESAEFSIIQSIREIRGARVMLDFDLANKYNVETRRLKEQVRRNIERFPSDFMFQLSKQEWEELIANCDNLPKKIKYSPITPLAFTQEGVGMLSGVLHSQEAIEANIDIMRAFVLMRKYVFGLAQLKQELEAFMRETNTRLDKNDMKFEWIFKLFDEYIERKKEQQKPRTPIGFKQGK